MDELSAVAYRFHWPLGELLDLEHHLRREFLASIHRLENGG